MAVERVRHHVIARNQSLPYGQRGCQFPRYSEESGLQVCGSNQKLIVHSIVPATFLALACLDHEVLEEKALTVAEFAQLFKEVAHWGRDIEQLREFFLPIVFRELKRQLDDPRNYIALCPTHHYHIYRRLHDLVRHQGKIDGQRLRGATVTLAQEGIRYWDWSYDPWFFQLAGENEARYQTRLIEEATPIEARMRSNLKKKLSLQNPEQKALF